MASRARALAGAIVLAVTIDPVVAHADACRPPRPRARRHGGSNTPAGR
jgi:hypothetical protein